MAKVKIQGHASGTGVITLTAPNTSTDRTITLPDSTGTLATTADTFDPDGAVTINDTGADVDFRVESDTDANALFVQGSSGKVGFGLEPTMGQVNIKTSGTFTTAFTDANGTAISMYSTDTAGDGKYGAAITWGALGGVNSHQAAISSVQTGSDANQVGLSMFTHNSTTGSAAMTEAIRVAHGGVMSVPNGIELGSGLDATAANTLDDYEEGTWTPTFNGSHIGSHTLNYATYTKIGRLVTVNCYVYNFGSIGGSGVSFGIQSLPFAQDHQATGTAGGSYYDINASYGHTVARGYIGTIYLEQLQDNGSSVWLDYGRVGANTHVQISLAYETNA